MSSRRIVVDTNVWVSSLRSKRGASYKLLTLLGSGKFITCVSVPLVVEYEKALLDSRSGVLFSQAEIGKFIDYVCAVSDRRKVYFLWRPFLRDAKDEMVVEAAVAGQCGHIVTFNVRHFGGVERFGIRAVTPIEFLHIIGEAR